MLYSARSRWPPPSKEICRPRSSSVGANFETEKKAAEPQNPIRMAFCARLRDWCACFRDDDFDEVSLKLSDSDPKVSPDQGMEENGKKDYVFQIMGDDEKSDEVCAFAFSLRGCLHDFPTLSH